MKPPTGGPSTGPNLCGHCENRHGLHEFGFSDAPEKHQSPDRHQHGAADPLQHAGRRQLDETIAEAAKGGPQGEYDDCRLEDDPRPEPVRDPPTDRNEDRKAQNIGCDRAAQRSRADPERRRDLRNGGGNDRAVQSLHEHGARDDQGDETRFRDHALPFHRLNPDRIVCSLPAGEAGRGGDICRTAAPGLQAGTDGFYDPSGQKKRTVAQAMRACVVSAGVATISGQAADIAHLSHPLRPPRSPGARQPPAQGR